MRTMSWSRYWCLSRSFARLRAPALEADRNRVRPLAMTGFCHRNATIGWVRRVSERRFDLLPGLLLGILATWRGSPGTSVGRATCDERCRRSTRTLALTEECRSPFPIEGAKVPNEESNISCGAAKEARSPVQRNHRKPSAAQGLPATGARPTLRDH
jgi:hypothetical protein